VWSESNPFCVPRYYLLSVLACGPSVNGQGADADAELESLDRRRNFSLSRRCVVWGACICRTAMARDRNC